jgi:hypothetical protein
MFNTWESVINFPVPGAGAAYASSNTATDISPAPQLTLPANFLVAGAAIRITAFGNYSSAGTAPTLVLGVYYGGASGTALAATTATTVTASAANYPWRLEYTGIIRTVGSTGTIMGQGYVDLGTSLTATTRIPIPSTALATVTIDTTTAKTLTVGATWGTNSGSNTLTLQGVLIESMA